jgi:PKD repeat protein
VQLLAGHGRDARATAAAFLLLALLPSIAHAAWLDGGWPYRRAIDVEWPAQPPIPEELTMVDFYTGGHHEKGGENIRVAGEDGRTVPCRVLMVGPGDRMRIAFAPMRGVRRYYVYFGHPNAPALKARDQLLAHPGLLLEMRKNHAGLVNNYRQIEAAFDSSKEIIGRTFVPRPFIGLNPFDDQTAIVSKYSGNLMIPQPGTYTIAASASDKAAVYLDGKPLVFAPAPTGDSRFNAKVDLTRGKHEFVVYHLNFTGEQRLSVGWQPPNLQNFEIIPAEAFGLLAKSSVGPMERKEKDLTSDFKIEYVAECFYCDHYSHRYRFTALTVPGSGRNAPACTWDFGDGQTATGPLIEHVYLVDGVYPVTLTIRSGRDVDTQTHRISVSRQYDKLDNPPSDNIPTRHAALVAQYNVEKISPAALPWAVALHVRTRQGDALEKTALRLAAASRQVDPAVGLWALQEAAGELVAQNKPGAAARIWEAVDAQSPLQPRAAQHHARLLLWQLADFPKAVKVLETQLKNQDKDPALKRLLAQALVLNQRAADAIKVFGELPDEGPADRRAALAGALARTIEFYIAESDWESGEAAWEKWQQQYPSDFFEGYSVMLQTRLIELHNNKPAAAKVAEAFALAMPKSSYAPRLLDRASKLLEKVDPARSKSLREMLKQKYPEDPLSQ